MEGSTVSPPDRPFDAFVPSEAEPFDTRGLCHLLRRTCFGPTPQRLAVNKGKSPAEVVNGLLSYDPNNDPFGALVDELEGFVNLNNTQSVASYWYYRMINSPQPVQERMALLWHRRWASSGAKVDRGRMMAGQIQTFRKLGIGKFHELALAMGRDPAMLEYLDGQYNRKGHANENYGREVMELFTLGIGNYTEKDVQELARAFTGWHIEQESAVFDPKQFDAGSKELFGKSSNYDSESAVDVLLAQPAASKHLARHLLVEFVHDEPTDAHVDYYAKRVVAHEFEVKPVLAEMLTSRLFYSDWAYRARIKSPVELAVGSALAMGGKVSTDFLRDACSRLGQSLLYPPNVKGWPGGKEWINSNTVLLRFNFAMEMATHRQNEFVRGDHLETWLAEHNVSTADDVLNHFSLLLLDGGLRDDAKEQLAVFLNHDSKGAVKPFKMSSETVSTRVRPVIHMMMTMPEYQLA